MLRGDEDRVHSRAATQWVKREQSTENCLASSSWCHNRCKAHTSIMIQTLCTVDDIGQLAKST